MLATSGLHLIGGGASRTGSTGLLFVAMAVAYKILREKFITPKSENASLIQSRFSRTSLVIFAFTVLLVIVSWLLARKGFRLSHLADAMGPGLAMLMSLVFLSVAIKYVLPQFLWFCIYSVMVGILSYSLRIEIYGVFALIGVAFAFSGIWHLLKFSPYSCTSF